MSIFHIHIIMLALAVVASFVVAGSQIFQRPAALGHKRNSCGQQRTLGFLAFIIVAVSPLIRFWRTSLTDTALLQQSLLVSATGLLALLLYALLQKPSRTIEPLSAAARQTVLSPSPIQIDADDTNNVVANDVDRDSTTTLDERNNQKPHPVTIQSSLADLSGGVDVINEPMNLGQAANDHKKASSSTDIDISNHVFLTDLERVMEDNKILESSIPTFRPTVEDGEHLDLSGTEELYAELRLQADGVDLPDNTEWLADFDESVDLDDSLVLADEHISTVTRQSDKSIIDGELLHARNETVDDAALEFGDDLTGEYAHPDVGKTLHHQGIATDEAISATLADTLAIGKAQNTELQEQIDALNSKLMELQTLRQQIGDTSLEPPLSSAETIVNQEKLLDQESEAREAADAVITQQREILSRSRHQQSLITRLLQEERASLANMRQEVEKSKETARQAAALARKAAIAHHSIRSVAKREQQARLRSEESVKRAVDIARNAISALAAEERKNAFYRN